MMIIIQIMDNVKKEICKIVLNIDTMNIILVVSNAKMDTIYRVNNVCNIKKLIIVKFIMNFYLIIVSNVMIVVLLSNLQMNVNKVKS